MILDYIEEDFLELDFTSFCHVMLDGRWYPSYEDDLIMNIDESCVEEYLCHFTHGFDITPQRCVLRWLTDSEYINDIAKGLSNPKWPLLEYAKQTCFIKRNNTSGLQSVINGETRTWANGMYGKFTENPFDQYEFQEICMDDTNHMEIHSGLPKVVADSFVGYWLQHTHEDVKETFENYFRLRKGYYIDKHKTDADSWRRNLDDEFIMQHVEDEKKYFDNCKLFDYLTKDERQKIKCYFDQYIEWFISLRRCPQNRNSINGGTIEPVKYDIAKHQNYIKKLFDWFLCNDGKKPKDFTFGNLLQCCENADFSPLAPKEDFTPNVGMLCYFIVYLEEQLNIGQTWRSKCATSIGKSNAGLTKNKPGKNWTDYPRNNSRLTEGSTKK